MKRHHTDRRTLKKLEQILKWHHVDTASCSCAYVDFTFKIATDGLRGQLAENQRSGLSRSSLAHYSFARFNSSHSAK